MLPNPAYYSGRNQGTFFYAYAMDEEKGGIAKNKSKNKTPSIKENPGHRLPFA